MLSILPILIAIPGAILSALTLISQLYFWQRKEYRWDRMRSFATSAEGHNVLSNWLLLGFGFLLIGWLSFFLSSQIASFWGWASIVSFVVHHADRIRTRGLLRPVLTLKALLVLGFACILFTGLLATYQPSYLASLQWATFIILAPLVVAVSVYLVNLVTSPRRQKVITSAATLRQRLKGLTVVGITGSYGKTSTKIFLDQLLTRAGIPHTASSAHRNSELAISQDMLKHLSSETNIYIAEMGAYSSGEIAALVRLAQPNIGIITCIGNQHLALFGSQAKLAAAK